jgi:hypothetical protein
MRIVLTGDIADRLREQLQLSSQLGVRDHSPGTLTPEGGG